MSLVEERPVAMSPPARPGRGVVTGFPRRWRRWWRYAVTSVVSTVVSEGVLLVLYGSRVADAAVAAVAATVAGTVPSYAMSRYWIWPDADRRGRGRQVAGYWVVAFVSLGISSLLTGAAAAVAPTGRVTRLVVVGAAYVGTYGLLWIAKFAVYERLLFRPVPPQESAAAPVGTGSAAVR